MIISKANDYAILVIGYLAGKHLGVVPCKREVSEKLNLPLEFTLKILQTLTRSGICESKRRKEGGSILTLTQEQILLKDIIEIMYGEFSMIAGGLTSVLP